MPGSTTTWTYRFCASSHVVGDDLASSSQEVPKKDDGVRVPRSANGWGTTAGMKENSP